MEIRKTERYYAELDDDSLCTCDACRNYYKEIRAACPELAGYLSTMGIDIEKPFEAMPLDPEADGTILYLAVQYVVLGDRADFAEADVAGVHIGLAESHPMTGLSEAHFVIELSSVRLKWTMGK